MIGYLVFLVLNQLKKIAMICFWCKSTRPREKEACLNILFLMTVFLADGGWIIYGSVFINSDEMEWCKSEGSVVGLTYISMRVIIGFTYFCLGLFVLALCFVCLVMKVLSDWRSMEDQQVE